MSFWSKTEEGDPLYVIDPYDDGSGNIEVYCQYSSRALHSKVKAALSEYGISRAEDLIKIIQSSLIAKELRSQKIEKRKKQLRQELETLDRKV